MGLLNYQSQLDIPQGTNPVSEMDSMQGPSFDLGSNSTLQIDSLQEVPGGSQNSPHQDLNIGPDDTPTFFQQPTDVISQAQISSLSAVPGGSENSPFQDLNIGNNETPSQYISNPPD